MEGIWTELTWVLTVVNAGFSVALVAGDLRDFTGVILDGSWLLTVVTADASAAVMVTDWEEFKNIDMSEAICLMEKPSHRESTFCLLNQHGTRCSEYLLYRELTRYMLLRVPFVL